MGTRNGGMQRYHSDAATSNDNHQSRNSEDYDSEDESNFNLGTQDGGAGNF